MTATLPPLLRQQLVEACTRLAAGPGLPTEADVLDEVAQPGNFEVGVALYRAYLTSVGDSFGLAVREVAERFDDVQRVRPVDGCEEGLSCDECADIDVEFLGEALDVLVGLIGDSSVDRMRRAVAA